MKIARVNANRRRINISSHIGAVGQWCYGYRADADLFGRGAPDPGSAVHARRKTSNPARPPSGRHRDPGQEFGFLLSGRDMRCVERAAVAGDESVQPAVSYFT